MIIPTRNRLIHGYLGIDHDTLRSIIQDDIPERVRVLKDANQRLKRAPCPRYVNGRLPES
ncbi:HepT-like ribonuclease domain-containing protein [Spiribacter curvatus]|uniref:HepT-like ribonuclease domain-containing protein n=1 Tax=Spiribacter curvatus TaxID=1335757 RepID=UPI002FF9C9C6